MPPQIEFAHPDKEVSDEYLDKLEDKLDWSGFSREKSRPIMHKLIAVIRNQRAQLELRERGGQWAFEFMGEADGVRAEEKRDAGDDRG
jgi:hypothetical protein